MPLHADKKLGACPRNYFRTAACLPEGNGLVIQPQDMALALRVRTPRHSIGACHVILAKTLLGCEGVHHESSPSTCATLYFGVLVVTGQSTYGNMDFLESWPIPAKWYLC